MLTLLVETSICRSEYYVIQKDM